MQNLTRILRQKLDNASKVAVLGVGSDLRGDDVAGITAVQQIEKTIKQKLSPPEVKFFIGATAPENLTGEIKKFQPSHLIIIDSVHSNVPPGRITVMKPEETEGVSFFTHKLPIKLMIDYLLQFCNCRVIIIGIQPKDIAIGSPVSKEIGRAVKKISEAITKILIAR
jgi:hydrogenase 3 maturation protease